MQTIFDNLYNKLSNNFETKRFERFGLDVIYTNIKHIRYAIVRKKNSPIKELRIYPIYNNKNKRISAEIAMWLSPLINESFNGIGHVMNFQYRVGEKVVAYVREK